MPWFMTVVLASVESLVALLAIFSHYCLPLLSTVVKLLWRGANARRPESETKSVHLPGWDGSRCQKGTKTSHPAAYVMTLVPPVLCVSGLLRKC